MNVKVVGATAVAMVGLSILGWKQLEGEANDPARGAVSASNPSPGRAGTNPRAVKAEPVAGSSNPTSLMPRHPFPEVPLTREDMDFEDDPGFAESRAEQQWLDLHGYPNLKQWQAYGVAPNEKLREAAAAGDGVAGAILDGRLLSTDSKAQERLVDAGVDGNLFALQLLASYHAGSRDGDLVAAYAVSRVSELRGDLRAAIGREAMLPAPLTPDQRLLGEAEAMRLNEEMNKRYFEKHGTPAEFLPRPIGRS